MKADLATHLLRNPELYGQLPPRRLKDRVVLIVLDMGVGGLSSWAVFRANDGYVGRRLRQSPAAGVPLGEVAVHGSEQSVDSRQVERFVAGLIEVGPQSRGVVCIDSRRITVWLGSEQVIDLIDYADSDETAAMVLSFVDSVSSTQV